jgi:hypothetical protein
MIKRWAEYVRTHDDEEWSRQGSSTPSFSRQTSWLRLATPIPFGSRPLVIGWAISSHVLDPF